MTEVPKNSAILAFASAHDREILRKILLVKPTRTLSGVAPVAVMTSPAPCPHGKCLPCPGGPDHPFKSRQATQAKNPRSCEEHNAMIRSHRCMPGLNSSSCWGITLKKRSHRNGRNHDSRTRNTRRISYRVVLKR
jgi:histone acetyltransferase (RNA polymerase elongator complex component)